jgi:hypothetical protein
MKWLDKLTVSERGLWDTDKPVIVPTGNGRITMKADPKTGKEIEGPVFAIDNTGYSQMMYPGGEYQFPGNMVYEIPMAQYGRQVKKSIVSAKELPEDTFPYEGTSAMFKDERYNIARAKELYKEDESGHLPSIDYETGEWLKAKRYPTSWKEYLQYALNPEVNKLGFPTENKEGFLKYPNYANGGDISIPDLSRPNWLDKAQKGQQVKYYDDPVQFKKANLAYQDSLEGFKKYPLAPYFRSTNINREEFLTENNPSTSHFSNILNSDFASGLTISPSNIRPTMNDYEWVYKRPTQKPVYKEKPKVEPIPYREGRLELSDKSLAPITYMPPSNTAAVLSKIKEEDMYRQASKVVPAPEFQKGGLATRADSLEVLNNTKQLEDYYRSYTFRQSMPVEKNDNWLNLLNDLRVGFNESDVRRTPEGQRKVSLDEYYKPVDANRFYQREIGDVVLDTRAPVSLFDKRIRPQQVMSVAKNDPKDVLHGDYVSIYKYDPLAITPWDMLSDADKKLRVQKYGVPEVAIPKRPPVPKNIKSKEAILEAPEDRLIREYNTLVPNEDYKRVYDKSPYSIKEYGQQGKPTHWAKQDEKIPGVWRPIKETPSNLFVSKKVKFNTGGWLEQYQEGSQVKANIPGFNPEVGPTVKNAQLLQEQKLQEAVRNSRQLPSGAIQPTLGPIEYMLLPGLAGSVIKKAMEPKAHVDTELEAIRKILRKNVTYPKQTGPLTETPPWPNRFLELGDDAWTIGNMESGRTSVENPNISLPGNLPKRTPKQLPGVNGTQYPNRLPKQKNGGWLDNY